MKREIFKPGDIVKYTNKEGNYIVIVTEYNDYRFSGKCIESNIKNPDPWCIVSDRIHQNYGTSSFKKVGEYIDPTEYLLNELKNLENKFKLK